MRKAGGITLIACLLLTVCLLYAVVSNQHVDAYSPPTPTPTPPPPTNPPPTAPTPTGPNPNWVNYDPNEPTGLITGAPSGIQINPGGEFDFSTQDPNGQIPEPPLPPQDGTPSETTSSQNPNEQIWIVLLDGTFSINTEKPQVDSTAYFIIGNNLVNNIGQKPNVYIGEGSAEILQFLKQEDNMFQAGMIAPETHLADFNLYGGNKPSYYVSGSTHISGDLDNPQNQSAVAVFTYQVTDANGIVVYQNKITGVASEGKTLADYWYQAAPDVNAYLENVIER